MPEKVNSFWKKYYVYLFYFYALASVFSISACTVIFLLFLLFYVLNPVENFRKAPKDFFVFLAIYLWKAATLLFNGLFSQLSRFINIWDKLPYVFASNLKIEEKNIKIFLKILFWANAAVIILALLQKYLGFPELVKPLFTPDMSRFKGYFSHPLRFAGYLSSVAVIACSFSIFYSGKMCGFFLVLLTGVFLTGSRSYFVSLIFASVILSFFRSRKFSLFFSAGLALYFGLMLAFSPAISTRVATAFSAPDSGTSNASLRLHFWKAAGEIFVKSPVYGVGDGQISGHLKPYEERGFLDNSAHAHNVYFSAAAETGIIGFGLLLFLFAYFLRKYFLEAKRATDAFGRAFAFSIFGCFANLAVSGIFESHFSTFIIWSFLTFYMGIFESYRRNS